MKLSAAYYPERYKPEQWKTDFEKMRNAGITCMRIAEFAWSRIEPNEGDFRWDWLDKSVALAELYGIQVIMCTPTSCPPIWLVEKYEEVLPVNEQGQRMVFGKRQHRCYNSKKYWEYTERIVEEMAKRYGNHPNVIAWQMDNEYGGERQRCYCKNCEKSFQKYLEEKYTDIHELNERWGNFFWSQDYQNFQQIKVPLEINGQLRLKYTPSLELEFWRFSSNSIVKYSNFQTGILRKYTKVPITTNTDPFLYGDTVRLPDLFKELDIGAIDVYTESLHHVGFYSDIVRSLKDHGKFYMTEFSTGSRNLSEEMDLLEKSGCELLSFFPMAAFPWGQEQNKRDGLLTLTGEPAKNYNVIKNWYDDNKDKKQVFPTSFKVGLYYDFESSWTFSIRSWGGYVDKWIYPIYVRDTVYRSAFEKHGMIKIIYQPSDIKDIDLLIVPKHILYDSELEDRLIRFVEDGGNLVVTDDFFIKDAYNVFMTHIPRIYKELLGWEENNFIDLNLVGQNYIINENSKGKGKTWIIRCDANLEQWASLMDQIS